MSTYNPAILKLFKTQKYTAEFYRKNGKDGLLFASRLRYFFFIFIQHFSQAAPPSRLDYHCPNQYLNHWRSVSETPSPIALSIHSSFPLVPLNTTTACSGSSGSLKHIAGTESSLFTISRLYKSGSLLIVCKIGQLLEQHDLFICKIHDHFLRQ